MNKNLILINIFLLCFFNMEMKDKFLLWLLKTPRKEKVYKGHFGIKYYPEEYLITYFNIIFCNRNNKNIHIPKLRGFF